MPMGVKEYSFGERDSQSGVRPPESETLSSNPAPSIRLCGWGQVT